MWYTIFKGVIIIKNNNTEQSNTYNSVGGYYNPNGTDNISFVRDPNKLIAQYHNLIMGVTKKYTNFWKTSADKKDLYSYVVDTFVSLVYEYDINSEVDFQGYIKRMLDIRVAKSYSMPEKDKRDHIFTVKSPTISVENLIDAKTQDGGTTALTWYNSKKSPDKIKDDMGNKVGIESKVDGATPNNEFDDSLILLVDALERDDRVNWYQLQLLHAIINYDSSVNEIIHTLAKEYRVDYNKMRYEYAKLKGIILEYAPLNYNEKQEE